MTIEHKSPTSLQEKVHAVAHRDEEEPPRAITPTPFAISSADVFELLNVLANRSISTVSGLAQRLDKAQSDVSQTLERLAFHGIVRLEQEGFEVRPELVSVELKINLVNKTIEAVLPPGSTSSPYG